MNHHNKFLLPDKSFWQALNREQRVALSSKYTILCPIILFTEFARYGLSPSNPYLNLENMIVVHHWSERAKMDLLTEEFARPMSLGKATSMQSILEGSEQELLAFTEVSGENIEMLEESEVFYRNLNSIINPLKEELLGLVNNTNKLSHEEWVNKLKEVMRANHVHYPEIERILKKIETEGFPKEGKERLQTSIKKFFDTYKADSLEKANQVATSLFNHDPSNCSAAHEILQRLCGLFDPILTQEERTQIFDRFLQEGMPPINRFAPYALGATIWNYTIQLLLRENSENAAPRDVLRDAEYLLYTYHNGITFVSADKWHKKFVDEVPLFKPLRENFIFVPHKNKNAEEFKKGLRALGLKVKEN